MWNSRRKEAANQELMAYVMHYRGMPFDTYGYDSKMDFVTKGYNYSWHGRDAAMFINDFLHMGADINCKDGMGNTPLIHAASGRQPDLAIALFRKYKADVNAANTYGDTPLTMAIITGHAILAQELLLAGAKADAKNVKGETAATLAAASPSKAIQSLVPYLKGEKPVTEIEAMRKKQEMDNAVLRAAAQGRPGDIKWALDQGGDINATDDRGRTPLMVAYGHETLAELLARGAKVDAQDNDGKTALFYAAENGRPNRVEALLKAGADPSITDKTGKTASDYTQDKDTLALLEDEIVKRGGNTPELIAARDKKRVTREFREALSRGDLLDVPALIMAGADPYATLWKGQNAMTFSIAQQQTSATAVLLAAGVDVNRADENGDTPLVVAYKSGRTRTFAALLKNGANPDVAYQGGESLLHTALSQGAGEIARLLIENKADITTPNKKGQSPVAVAVFAGGQSETIRAFGKAGANLNEADADGNTLLMKSLLQNRDQTSIALVEAGADVTLKNAKGQTALDICGQNGPGGLYREIKKREDAARDKRIADLEAQVKQLGGDVTNTPAAPVPPAPKAAAPGKAP